MASLSIAGMIASSFLPETFRQTLPETIEGANNFGKGNKFWSFLPSTDSNNKIETQSLNEKKKLSYNN